MTVNLAQIILAAEARRASVAGEVAGYLILAAADQLARAPRSFDATELLLDERGEVSVGRGLACASEASGALLRTYLGELLGVARPLPPALLRATRRGGGVEELVRELEAGLIPVNRAAARRALSRLSREVSAALPSLDAALLEEPARARPEALSTDPAPPPSLAEAWEPELPRPPKTPTFAAPLSADEHTCQQPAVARRVRREQAARFTEVESPTDALMFADGEATERVPLAEVVAAFDTPSEAVSSVMSSAAAAQHAEGQADAERSAQRVPAPSAAALLAGVVSPRQGDVLAGPSGTKALGSSQVRDRQSDVRELLSGFQVAETRTDRELSRVLKSMAGIDLTPLAPEPR